MPSTKASEQPFQGCDSKTSKKYLNLNKFQLPLQCLEPDVQVLFRGFVLSESLPEQSSHLLHGHLNFFKF
jgi:hypothetical protein